MMMLVLYAGNPVSIRQTISSFFLFHMHPLHILFFLWYMTTLLCFPQAYVLLPLLHAYPASPAPLPYAFFDNIYDCFLMLLCNRVNYCTECGHS